MLAAEPEAGRHPQRTTRVELAAGHGFTHVIDPFKNLLGCGIHAFTIVGDRHAPRRAVKQRHTQGFCEDRDALADERRRYPELNGRRRETRLACCKTKYPQVVELKVEAHDS